MSATDWHQDAACRGDANPDLWFASPATAAGERLQNRARRICAVCPVKQQCADWAMEQGGTLEGVWGGLDRTDRDLIRMRRRKQRARQERLTASAALLADFTAVREAG